MKLLTVTSLVACSIAFVHDGAHAIEKGRSSLGQAGASIENCVVHDWIHFGSQDQSAILDDTDHRLVRAEMIQRYPVIENDGMPASRTILWQKPSGELLYVAVFDDPVPPGRACFTATFSADKFDATSRLRRKYLVPITPAE